MHHVRIFTDSATDRYSAAVSVARRYSRLRRAMFETEMPTGQAASHSLVFVHPPKPSSSMRATIACTRLARSGRPWGNSANCDTLAETNSMAEAFLQAATHAPQPMQVAASNALSASCLGTSTALPSGALPVLTETYPPAV